MTDIVLYSEELEEAVLCLCMKQSTPGEWIDQFTVDDFWQEGHKEVLKSINRLRQAGEGYEFNLVYEEMNKSGTLQYLRGGIATLGYIATRDVWYTSFALESYAKALKEYTERRKAVALAQGILKSALDPSQAAPLEKAALDATHAAKSMRRADRKGYSSPKERVAKTMERNDKRMEDPRHVYGISTGFTGKGEFDYMTHGLVEGRLILILGAPGMGKSIAGYQMALSAAKQGFGAAVFSLEMAESIIDNRFISDIADVPLDPINDGTIINNPLWMEKYYKAIEQYAELPIYTSTRIGSLTEFGDICHELAMEHGVRVVVVDYLRLLAMYVPGNASQPEKVEAASAFLKEICNSSTEWHKDFDADDERSKYPGLTIVAISDVTKDGMDESGNASITHAKGAGGVSHDPDAIFEIRPEYKPKGKIIVGNENGPVVRSVFCVKDRHGNSTGKYFNLQFNPHGVARLETITAQSTNVNLNNLG